MNGAQGEEPMTEPLRWPNVAAEARDRSAEEANRIIFALTPVFDPEVGFNMTEIERVRRVGIAIHSAERIARLLERQGAKTRPI